MTELIFQKELIQIKQVHQKSVIFAIIGIFFDKNFNYGPCLYNGCHDLIQRATSFKNVAIVSIKVNYYRIHFYYISKNDSITLMTNSVLSDKDGVL